MANAGEGPHKRLAARDSEFDPAPNPGSKDIMVLDGSLDHSTMGNWAQIVVERTKFNVNGHATGILAARTERPARPIRIRVSNCAFLGRQINPGMPVAPPVWGNGGIVVLSRALSDVVATGNYWDSATGACHPGSADFSGSYVSRHVNCGSPLTANPLP